MLDLSPNPRATLITAGIFAGVALLLASPALLPKAIADEQPAKTLLSAGADLFPAPLDTSTLTKWDFVSEPGVSTDALNRSQVRKVAYGKTTFVDVVETTSGVYSTDGLNDPHVQYPGIHPYAREAVFSGIKLLNNGRWVAEVPFDAGSFITIVPFDGGQLVTTDKGQCVISGNDVSC